MPITLADIPSDNTFFNDIEKKELIIKLDEVKAFIEQKYQLSDEKLAYIDRELSYVKDATGKLNKRDWKAVAQSIILNIAINLASDGIVAVGSAVVAYAVPQAFQNFILHTFRLLIQ